MHTTRNHTHTHIYTHRTHTQAHTLCHRHILCVCVSSDLSPQPIVDMQGQTCVAPQAKARGSKPCAATRQMMSATARSRAPSAMTPMWQEAETQCQYMEEAFKAAYEADMTVSEVSSGTCDAVSVELAKSAARDAWDVVEKAVVGAEKTIQIALRIQNCLDQKTSQKRRRERAHRRLPPPSLKVRFRASMSLARIIGSRGSQRVKSQSKPRG